ncbi:MAG TPA: hypothetical protein VGD91_18480 [Trebonia sp.]
MGEVVVEHRDRVAQQRAVPREQHPQAGLVRQRSQLLQGTQVVPQ